MAKTMLMIANCNAYGQNILLVWTKIKQLFVRVYPMSVDPGTLFLSLITCWPWCTELLTIQCLRFSCVIMTQRHLSGQKELPVALKDIKKEPEHTVLLHCVKCPRSTEVFIDSQCNVSPYLCMECWSREPSTDHDDKARELTEIASSTAMQSFALIWTPTGLQAVPLLLPSFSSLVWYFVIHLLSLLIYT